MIRLSDLIDRCGASPTCRELDAEIAIAFFDGVTGRSDPRDHEHARRVMISHGAQPGDYEISGFSGVSLRSAPHHTATAHSRAAAQSALFKLVALGDAK